VPVDLGVRHVELATDAGVFSHTGLDPGTAVLLREAPLSVAAGEVLDLGCGYGPIALALAEANPGATVWAVDVNSRALELTAANAARLGAGNVRVCSPDEVPEATRFAAVYANPPIRIGKPALHELLARWLARLQPAGVAYLVVARNLGADSLARWLADEGFGVRRLSAHRGYRVLAVG
jgi:16S rRNA G1207 methylase RsmC